MVSTAPAQVRAVHTRGPEEMNGFLCRVLPAVVRPQVNTGFCVGSGFLALDYI